MATVTNLNDKIFAQDVLEGFVATLTPLNAFATNFSDAAVQKGDTVIVPIVSNVVATTFNQTYTTGGGTNSVVTISLSRHKISSVGITDVQAHNSSTLDGSRTNFYAYQVGQGLAQAVLEDIWSLVTTGTFGAASVTTAAANYSITQVRALRKALNEANVPMAMRSLILDVDPYDALLSQSNFYKVNESGSNATLREGSVGRILGFDVYETNVLPLNGISLAGFACHPSALAVAMRYNAPLRPEAYIDAYQVSDPSTGATLGVRRLYEPETGQEFLNFEALYGYAAGLTLGLKLCTVP